MGKERTIRSQREGHSSLSDGAGQTKCGSVRKGAV